MVESINEGRGIEVGHEIKQYCNERLENPMVYSLLKFLETKGIAYYDTEDDSRLVALGEGKIVWSSEGKLLKTTSYR